MESPAVELWHLPAQLQALAVELWHLPAQLQALIAAEVRDGERITWAGAPLARRFAMRALPIVLFAIPWTAFSLFWIAGAAGFKVPDFNQPFDLFPLFGVPFLLIGLGMLGSPYWMMRKARRTAYVLTTARAIVFDGGFSTTIRSFEPDRLRDLRRSQRPDGSGDLIFERTITDHGEGARGTTDNGFLAIADVKKIEDLVRQLVATVSPNRE